MLKASEQDVQKVFTRRALVLAGGKLALIGALGARLYYLQVVEADRYELLSRGNQFNLELLPPVRGRILDRNGVALADNQDNFRVEIVREQTDDVAATLSALRSIIEVPDWDVRRVLKDVKRKRAFVPVTVVENLTREEIARVAVNAPYLPGIRIEVGRSRRYPFADTAVHITGYVAAVSESELTGDPVLELPDFRIGKSGIEKLHDLGMRGTAGRRQVEVNALGRIIRKLPGEDGEPGRDVKLTLDINLQRYATERLSRGNAERLPTEDPRAQLALAQAEPAMRDLYADRQTVLVDAEGKVIEAESGSAVVMDVHTGELRALASAPGYDPNPFNRGLSAKDWEELLTNPRGPLNNKAVSGQYPPGSTFKMLVMLAALESGLAGPDTKFFCPGHLTLGDTRFHCWSRYGHGWLDMKQSIAQSCDVYYYELAKRIGIDRISSIAKRFGLGELTGVDIPGERRGLVPSREWKLATTGVPWQMGETLVAAIGQGFNLATPLQLALMTARLVNGGKAVVPHIEFPNGPPEAAEDMAVDTRHLEAVRVAMSEVVNGPRGTARKIQGSPDDVKIGGKTGTAQVRRITMADRASGAYKEEKPWRFRDHALFVGFGPVEAPRYAVAVVVEHGGGGSSMAAPIGADVLREALRIDPPGPTASGESGAPTPERQDG
ncbi:MULTISPECIES: penicillin-binding protein 2 [Thalassobaculum]|uniref:Penicillin-binding protein 2 n=1 Tax=Thalassobaculum litoreum DSM 18839 TaxID=1123362 RepID=A0A8G2BHI6_9PROT|nr:MULTISPECIES: penicillin-binding protein 2 [Thalassobaculum]SDF44394.1 penicillin-binding protein 2 [Thalassobaculum litoreum DSM 18839]